MRVQKKGGVVGLATTLEFFQSFSSKCLPIAIQQHELATILKQHASADDWNEHLASSIWHLAFGIWISARAIRDAGAVLVACSLQESESDQAWGLIHAPMHVYAIYRPCSIYYNSARAGK